MLWPLAWAALCIVAVCVGAAARMSYSDSSSDARSFTNLAYVVAPYSIDDLERLETGLDSPSIDELGREADLVVLGSIGDTREYVHKSLLTDFHIKWVIKGSPSEDGSSIKVFEPIGIYKGPDGKVLVPGDAYMFGGGVPMRPEIEYVLFLERVEDSVGIDGYILSGSPYSKVPVSDNVAYRVNEPGEYGLPLGEYADCDIVVADERSLENYECAQQAILDFVGE